MNIEQAAKYCRTPDFDRIYKTSKDLKDKHIDPEMAVYAGLEDMQQRGMDILPVILFCVAYYTNNHGTSCSEIIRGVASHQMPWKTWSELERKDK